MLIGSSRRVVEPAPLEIPRETARIWRETHAIACNVRPPLGEYRPPRLLGHTTTAPPRRLNAIFNSFEWGTDRYHRTLFYDFRQRNLNFESTKFPIFPRFYWSSELIDYRRQYLNNKIVIGCFLNPRLD